jgi:hypothetical protein
MSGRPTPPAQILTARFYAWERRGRGWGSFAYPVSLEPAFRPFEGYVIDRPIDDGRKPHLVERLFGSLFGREDGEVEPEDEEEDPEPDPFERDFPLVEFAVSVPPGTSVGAETTEAWLSALSACELPLAFEIVGLPDRLQVVFVCREPDRAILEPQLQAFFPEVIANEADELFERWCGAGEGEPVIIELGLAREWLLPISCFRRFDPDPLLAVFGALSKLGAGEIGLFQVLFTPVRHRWAESALRAVVMKDGKPFFPDAPEITKKGQEKVNQPLFAAVIRLAAKGANTERSWQIVRALSGAMQRFGSPSGNELVPLSESEEIDLELDLLARQTHRSGMLLGSEELLSLVHLPAASVRIPALRRTERPSKVAPDAALQVGVILGTNTARGQTVPVHLPPDLRSRHLHILGGSGTGKSTLLLNLVLQDIEAGTGVGVIDPHGDLIEELLGRIPESRIKDVVLFDPADETQVVGWNILAANSEVEQQLLASDLVGLFRRFSTSWGDQMTSVLANAVLAFLESHQGGTLLDLRDFLTDPATRRSFLGTVEDPYIRSFWERDFPQIGTKALGPILTRLDTFLRSKLVRRVVAERENRLDFRELLDSGKIFLGKLAQGAIGEENAALLGALLVSKFHQVALSRQDLAPEERRLFSLYVDECQEVATPSMAGLLSGTRKYRLGLTLVHQELRQLEQKAPEVAGALLANAGTRICFRVGEEDARKLERGFASFAAADLVNLGVGEAICRMERSEGDFNLTTLPLPEVLAEEAQARREEIRALGRKRYGRREEPLRRIVPKALEPAVVEDTAPPPVAPSPPPPVATRPASKAPKVEKELPALGRGGPEHQYLQELVKRWAESKGYRVTVEKPILDGAGSVDVAIETKEWSLACEISVTTTTEQEVGNVEKCLAAGFNQVVLVSRKKQRLARVRTALKKRLEGEKEERVLFLTPEELLSYLENRPATTEKEKTVGGYRVNVRYKQEGEGAAKKREAVAKVVARSVGRVRGK